jgi:hypothetical protein
MTTTVRLRQLELVAHLTAAGIPATDDPAHVMANLPIVLVAPPELGGARLGGGWATASWRLLVIGGQVATLAAVEASWQLLEATQEALPITDARPGTYQLGQDLVLCYVATFPDNTADWPPATP